MRNTKTSFFLASLIFTFTIGAVAATPTAGTNVRVTVDTGSVYLSADQIAGGTYTDAVLQRCGIDRRSKNEPTLAIDPRNPSVWTSGSNDYCTIPTAGDAGRGSTAAPIPGQAGQTACCLVTTATLLARARLSSAQVCRWRRSRGGRSCHVMGRAGQLVLHG